MKNPEIGTLLKVDTPHTTALALVSAAFILINSKVGDRLLMSPARSLGECSVTVPNERLDTLQQQALDAFIERVRTENYEWLMEEEDRLSRYATMLPDLQRGLPVPAEYKQETPGSDSDLNAYDVVFYAGDCNAGAKTIASACPFCMTMLSDGLKDQEKEGLVRQLDVVELLAESCLPPLAAE